MQIAKPTNRWRMQVLLYDWRAAKRITKNHDHCLRCGDRPNFFNSNIGDVMSVIIFLLSLAAILDYLLGGGTPPWLAVIALIGCAATWPMLKV